MIIMPVLKKTIFLISVLLLCSSLISAAAEDHIKDLRELRLSMLEQGKFMPDLINQASTNIDLSTLERIYELNTSALTTIEAYFRMVRLIISSGLDINDAMVKSLNEWLLFIKNQCRYDISYLEQALAETNTQAVITQINAAKYNIRKLSEISELGIKENNQLIN